MKPFKYTRATNAAAAAQAVFASPGAHFLGGGTNLLDLMREGVENPSELVDIARLNLTQIRGVDGGVSIGALAKNTDTANQGYVTGIEPGTNYAYPVRIEREQGRVRQLQPGESVEFTLTYTLLSSADEVQQAEREVQEIQNGRETRLTETPIAVE